KRGAANHAMGSLNQAISDLSLALNEAHALGDRELQGPVLIALCHALFFAHRLDEMIVHTAEAMRLAEETGNGALRAAVLGLSGRRHAQLGHLTEAIAEQNECIRLARKFQDKPALLSGLAWRALIHFFSSEYQTAEEMLIQVHDLSTELREGLILM